MLALWNARSGFAVRNNIASSSDEELPALLAQAGLRDLLDAAVPSDEVKASKPDGDIIEVALRKAGVQPTEAVMIGDTPYDIVAAEAAGVGEVQPLWNAYRKSMSTSSRYSSRAITTDLLRAPLRASADLLIDGSFATCLLRQHRIGNIQHRSQAIHMPQIMVVADPDIPARRLVGRVDTL